MTKKVNEFEQGLDPKGVNKFGVDFAEDIPDGATITGQSITLSDDAVTDGLIVAGVQVQGTILFGLFSIDPGQQDESKWKQGKPYEITYTIVLDDGQTFPRYAILEVKIQPVKKDC